MTVLISSYGPGGKTFAVGSTQTGVTGPWLTFITVLTTGSDNTESEDGSAVTGAAVTVTNTGVTVTTLIDNPENPGPGKADATNALGVGKESGASDRVGSDVARVLIVAISERSRAKMREAGIMAMLVDRSVVRIRDEVEQSSRVSIPLASEQRLNNKCHSKT